MPVIYSSYPSPIWQFNGHVQSIYPSLFRKIIFQYTKRERLELEDGDFVDLDWYRANETGGEMEKLVIITHGLEGNSQRHYVLGMARSFAEKGFDVLAWNCRSCSGEINRSPRFYHHGDTEDLRAVIQHAESRKYNHISLVGFSMGGSLSLRIAGENPLLLSPSVKSVIAFSVPCDLLSSAAELNKIGKRFYQDRFLRKLGRKIKIKSELFPHLISYEGYERIHNFEEFDNKYTAPLHGFKDARDFYARASVKPFLPNIRIPSLLVQALNDPFLTPECIVVSEANGNSYLILELTQDGGHCGFMQSGKAQSWAEQRAVQFALENSQKENSFEIGGQEVKL